MKYAQWLLYWLPLFIVGIVFRFISPIACLFIVRKPRFDTVKRLGKKKVLLERDDLVWWLSWFGTHDNDVSEYWYGMYGFTATKSQAWYDNSRFWRWVCRVLWLQRNSAYGFNYRFFSKPLEPVTYTKEYGSEQSKWWLLFQNRASSFQLEIHHPLWKGKYSTINIGWKPHTDQARLLYAGRILGIRKG